MTAALGLLDTSVLIDPPADLAVVVERIFVSAISVAELAYGVQVASNPVDLAVRERRYREVLSTFDPLPLSASAAHWYGAVAASVQRSGRKPRRRAFDLLLAAVAADMGAVLVTRNADDFAGLDGIVSVISAS